MRSLPLLVFAVLSLLILVDSSPRVTMVSDAEWTAYKRKFNKHYPPEHDYYHQWHYSRAAAAVRKNNLEYAQGKVAYQLKISARSDSDRSALYANPPPVPTERSMAPEPKPANYKYYKDIKEGIDWRQSGFVSSVKDQGECNSCWAFSTTGLLEAHMAKKTGRRVSLSPKHLLDCVKEEGCKGSYVSTAINYIRDNGISPWESYSPYKPQNETCNYHPRNKLIKPRGFVVVEPDEEKIAEVVYNIGPVTVSVDYLYEEFYDYSTGILSIKGCRSDRQFLQHSMLIVGFGTDHAGSDYWLIKNSYGTAWGENGYLRLARNAGNMCGVASMVQYPVF